MAARLTIPPAVQGAGRKPLRVTWQDDEGQPGFVAAGATLSGRIRHLQSGQTRDIAGSLAVVGDGVFDWPLAAEDVSTTGMHYVQITASYASGLPERSFAARWDIEEAL